MKIVVKLKKIWNSGLNTVFWFLLGALITQVGNDYNAKKNYSLENFDSLKLAILDLSVADENIYKFCKNYYQQDKSKLLPEIKDSYYSDLNLLHKERIQAHKKLVSTIVRMRDKKTLNEQSYNSVKIFARWNDMIGKVADRSDEICKMPLKNVEELEEWRERLITNVLKSQ